MCVVNKKKNRRESWDRINLSFVVLVCLAAVDLFLKASEDHFQGAVMFDSSLLLGFCFRLTTLQPVFNSSLSSRSE